METNEVSYLSKIFARVFGASSTFAGSWMVMSVSECLQRAQDIAICLILHFVPWLSAGLHDYRRQQAIIKGSAGQVRVYACMSAKISMNVRNRVCALLSHLYLNSIHASACVHAGAFLTESPQPFMRSNMIWVYFALLFVRASSLFTFSHSLGAAYSGVWANPTRIVITIQDVNGAGPPPILEFWLQVKFCYFLSSAKKHNRREWCSISCVGVCLTKIKYDLTLLWAIKRWKRVGNYEIVPPHAHQVQQLARF